MINRWHNKNQFDLWMYLMFGKICSSFFRIPKVDLTKLRVGRMAAETQVEVVENELVSELKTVGLRQLKETIRAEQELLRELIRQRENDNQAIRTQCIEPALERSARGYNVGGLFWENTQRRLQEIVPSEVRIRREETIDWLSTRKKLFEELDRFPIPEMETVQHWYY